MIMHRGLRPVDSMISDMGFIFRETGLLLLALLAIWPASGQSRTYRIVASESSLWVFVEKAGLLSAFAHNHEIGVRSWSGTVTLPDSGVAGASAQLDIDAKSLVVLDKKVSDKDRSEIFDSMHREVLESEKYPRIAFRSVSITGVAKSGENRYGFTLNGDLSLHGTTKRIAVPLTATVTPAEIRVSGKYRLKQTDYGIKPYSAAGGTIKVRDTVTINFSIVARP